MPYSNTDVGKARPMLQAKLRVPQPVRSVESLDQAGGFAALKPLPLENKALFFGDSGKKKFAPNASDTYEFKPGRRKLYPNKSGSAEHGGIKKLPHPVPFAPPRAEQRHLPEAAARSGYDIPEHSIEKALNRKILVRRPSGSLGEHAASPGAMSREDPLLLNRRAAPITCSELFPLLRRRVLLNRQAAPINSVSKVSTANSWRNFLYHKYHLPRDFATLSHA